MFQIFLRYNKYLLLLLEIGNYFFETEFICRGPWLIAYTTKNLHNNGLY